MYAIDLYGFLVISKSHSLVVKFILLVVSAAASLLGVDAAGVYRVVVLLVAKK